MGVFVFSDVDVTFICTRMGRPLPAGPVFCTAVDMVRSKQYYNVNQPGLVQLVS